MTIPVIDIVGVAVMVSEKLAVMVTVLELERMILSLSESVRFTVGAVVSRVKVMLSVPE